jgi:hypothetical protein
MTHRRFFVEILKIPIGGFRILLNFFVTTDYHDLILLLIHLPL